MNILRMLYCVFSDIVLVSLRAKSNLFSLMTSTLVVLCSVKVKKKKSENTNIFLGVGGDLSYDQ